MGCCGKINATIAIIEALQLTIGFGQPDEGNTFFQASDQFTSIATKLLSSIPGMSWIGTASEKYAQQNNAQQLRAKAFADIDKFTGGILKQQAADVRATRSYLETEIYRLDKWCRPIAKALDWIPFVGGALADAFQWAWCGIAMWKVNGALGDLAKKTFENMKNLFNLNDRLQDLIKNLPDLLNFDWKDWLPKFPDIDWGNLIPPEWKDWLPKWDDILNPDKWPSWDKLFPIPNIPGLDGIVDWVKNLPSLPIFAGLPGLGEFTKWLKIPGFPDLSQLIKFPGMPDVSKFLQGIPGLPQLGQLPSLPNMGNLTSTLKQLSGLSGQMGQMSSLTQQVGQPLQQVVQAGQQSQQQDDQKEDGASGGDGERAPVLTLAGEKKQEEGTGGEERTLL